MPSALLRLRSDEQLVAHFRSGSDDAFRVIHDRYRARLFAYARQMLGGSRTDAEDALQDVFLRAYNALRDDERPVVLKAWLYRVAHNRCIDQIRRPTPPAAEVFEVSRTPMPDPLAEAERREDLRRLIADVQRLPEHQRSALLMREMEGLSYADLAQALDTSIPAVKSLLVRARIGLVEAAEARNTACIEIRNDLALSFGKGVRASARARKHMRECAGCREYRADLRGVQTGLGALMPGGHPLGLLAKLLGIGGASGGAAAGGAAAGGGGAALVGGGVVAGTTAKVAAVVCCAAVVGGGTFEIKKHAAPQGAGTAQSSRHAASGGDGAKSAGSALGVARAWAPASVGTFAPERKAATAERAQAGRARRAVTIAKVSKIPAGEEVISPHVAEDPPALTPGGVEAAQPTGGAMAPSETAPPTATDATGTPPATSTTQVVAAAPTEDDASTGTQAGGPATGQAAGSPANPAATTAADPEAAEAERAER